MPRPDPPTNKGTKFPAEPLTRTEMRALIQAASNRSHSGIRMRALLAVLCGSGLRIEEALLLMPRDIDTAKCTIRVRHGKGNKARTVGIDPDSCAIIDRWLDQRTALGMTGRQTVFATYTVGSFGRPISQRYARTAIARVGERAGIEKRVHPHGLRHSLATALAEEGVPLHVISAQLGHSSTATTDRYLRKIAPAELVARMQQRTWLEEK